MHFFSSHSIDVDGNMSDQIKHECGLAMIRLLKPLEFYHQKYGTALYGLNKLNYCYKNSATGAGWSRVATIKFDIPPGNRYISRHRSIGSSYLKDLLTLSMAISMIVVLSN